ncbi:transglycosylase domain-containing protein [Chryseolinea sp. H1M3-3]|uniref:transglycosylase domain-containing protein n=1 Tax=Chryseolinea sp. H1M3-3 TaxID=3034144 RepID=UPI0023EC95E5|nr:transglycosylase domain-containing protein [Chryseolinea sp. H1M3-3]
MQSFIEKLKYFIRDLFFVAVEKVQPLLMSLWRQFNRLLQYLKTHPKAKRWTIIAGPPILLLLILLIIVWIETPSKKELRNIQNQVASEVFSSDSVLLGRYYIQDRTEVQYENISKEVINALIATEDARFYEHEGIDFVSLGRVIVKSIFLQDESAGGGSTLSQQLSKNLYPREKYWVLSLLINKLREVSTAYRLENLYTKEELLTMYLNTIPFADNAFGIQAAAKRFFSTTADALTTDQAAMLIGQLKATHNYNPRLFPKRALERRNVVLNQMVKYNFLEEKKAESLKKRSLGLKYSKVSHHQGLAPYFREYLKSELISWCKTHTKEDGTPYNLYTDGLRIYTTIDSKLQLYAENALVQQMTEVQKQFFDHWGKEVPWKGKESLVQEAIVRSPRYQRLKQQGLSEKEIMAIMQKRIPMRLFTWQGEKDIKASPIDSIKHHLQYLNAGFLAMEPATGEVKAWVGGIEHDFYQYDHVKTSTKRQVGSIFKPIVYAMAIEEGILPCDLFSAQQETYIDKEGVKWTPRNMQNDYNVQYSMRGALAYSVNTVAVKLIQEAGVNNTIELARKMGISSELPDVPSIALGSSSISLMEMTTAYACLANEGVTNLPFYIKEIYDLEGKVYNDFKPKGSGKRAISKETALLVRQLMQTVVHEGTASRLRWRYGIYTDVAGKTGTTQANADGWFMAITPKLAIGSWVGADDPRIRFRNTKLGQGSNTALPIAAYFLKQVNQDPNFKSISSAKFKPLPNELQQELQCDLYELDDVLWADIEKTIFKRDSIMHADSLAKPPQETFLETLYKRKLRMQQAAHRRDSINALPIRVDGG